MQGPQGSQDVAIATASKQPRQLLKVLDAVLDVYGFRNLNILSRDLAIRITNVVTQYMGPMCAAFEHSGECIFYQL